jgi:hypothetical protein
MELDEQILRFSLWSIARKLSGTCMRWGLLVCVRYRMDNPPEHDDKSRMAHRRMILHFCTVAILCSGEEAWAQTIYKQMDSAGAITFSDRPAADESLKPNTRSPSLERGPLAVSRANPGTYSDVTDALARNVAMSSAYAAAVDCNEAKGRLERARERREEGIEPRPGERAESSGAGITNIRYRMRQRGLQREVVAAERRSHQTSMVQSAYVVVFLNRPTTPP